MVVHQFAFKPFECEGSFIVITKLLTPSFLRVQRPMLTVPLGNYDFSLLLGLGKTQLVMGFPQAELEFSYEML